MAKTIALLATLDTKGVEIAYMRDYVIAPRRSSLWRLTSRSSRWRPFAGVG
jgi:hypothetical protein